MQDVEVVAQQALGMEGGLLIEAELGGIAAVDLSTTVGMEKGVRLIHVAEVGECHALAAIVVADEPGVGLLDTVKYSLEGKGDGATLGIVVKDITSSCISDELCHGATTSRDVPG